jgi:hypothetical protein
MIICFESLEKLLLLVRQADKYDGFGCLCPVSPSRTESEPNYVNSEPNYVNS